MKVTYIGPHEEVWVPDAGVKVKNGESIDVPDRLVEGLLCQVDNWVEDKPKRAPKKGDD